MSAPWWTRETRRSVVLSVVIVLIGAILIGGLTSPAQGVLPAWLNSLSNSAGGWTMFAFLLVWASGARPLLAALLGIVAFVALVESYGMVSLWRGAFSADPFASKWTLIGIVAGPVIGVAASLVRFGSPTSRLLAVTPLSAVLLGEGVWALQHVADTTSPVYWVIEIVLSAVFLGVAAVVARPRRLMWPVAAAVTGVGAVAYSVLIGIVGAA